MPVAVARTESQGLDGWSELPWHAVDANQGAWLRVEETRKLLPYFF